MSLFSFLFAPHFDPFAPGRHLPSRIQRGPLSTTLLPISLAHYLLVILSLSHLSWTTSHSILATLFHAAGSSVFLIRLTPTLSSFKVTLSASHFPSSFYALGRVPARKFSKTHVPTSPGMGLELQKALLERNLTLTLLFLVLTSLKIKTKANPIPVRSLLTRTFTTRTLLLRPFTYIVPTERNISPVEQF